MESQNPKDTEINDDILEQALEDFEKEEKLNLTTDDKDRDEAEDPEIEKEFENFMKGLGQSGQGSEEDAMKQLSSLMAGLMNEMKSGENNGEEGPAGPTGANFAKMFEGLMGSLDGGDMDSATNMFLEGVMEKDLLQEPLTEAKKHYETYLEENKGKLTETESKNYTEQYNCITQLIEVLDTEPNNKPKMIGLFEKMHEYGSLPPGILNPFESQIPSGQGFPGAPGGFPGAPGGFPGGPGIPGMPSGGFGNLSPEDLQKQMDGCNMF